MQKLNPKVPAFGPLPVGVIGLRARWGRLHAQGFTARCRRSGWSGCTTANPESAACAVADANFASSRSLTRIEDLLAEAAAGDDRRPDRCTTPRYAKKCIRRRRGVPDRKAARQADVPPTPGSIVDLGTLAGHRSPCRWGTLNGSTLRSARCGQMEVRPDASSKSPGSAPLTFRSIGRRRRTGHDDPRHRHRAAAGRQQPKSPGSTRPASASPAKPRTSATPGSTFKPTAASPT